MCVTHPHAVSAALCFHSGDAFNGSKCHWHAQQLSRVTRPLRASKTRGESWDRCVQLLHVFGRKAAVEKRRWDRKRHQITLKKTLKKVRNWGFGTKCATLLDSRCALRFPHNRQSSIQNKCTRLMPNWRSTNNTRLDFTQPAQALTRVFQCARRSQTGRFLNGLLFLRITHPHYAPEKDGFTFCSTCSRDADALFRLRGADPSRAGPKDQETRSFHFCSHSGLKGAACERRGARHWDEPWLDRGYRDRGSDVTGLITTSSSLVCCCTSQSI